MKKLIFSLMLSVLFLSTSTAQQRGYDRTGYDGDFFSLEGTLEVFKNSNSIKDFERRLNTRDSWVNNLDLNLDGQTDYIRVEHRRQGDYHAIILQVPISRREVQDVAVIEIEKTGRRRATLQIVGDEYLYGEQVLVEPFEGDAYSSGRGGPNADYNFRRGYVNVYYWPSVRHILRRSYNPWISPYRYSYYPNWWSPWRPSPWDTFYPNVIVYNRNFQIVYVHRLRNVYNFYRPYRVYCPSVYQRTNVVRVNRTNRRVTPSFSKARVKQRASVAQANGSRAKNGRLNPTGRTTTSQANPPRTSRANKNSRAANTQSTQKSNSRYSSKTRAERSTNSPSTRSQSKSKANSSRSNSTYSPKSSSRSRTNQSTSRSNTNRSNTRSSSRTKATSPSRSSRSNRAGAAPSRSRSQATSRSSSRSNRSSSARTSRSSQKSLPRVSRKKKQ